MFSPILSTSSNGDRNILFAALALQLDYLETERFTELWRAWKSQTLMPWPDFLVARNHLSTEERQSLERLVERKLGKHDGHVEACLQDLAGERTRRALASVAPGWEARSESKVAFWKTKERNGRAGARPAPAREQGSRGWRERLGSSRVGKYRRGPAAMVGAAALLVLVAVGILLKLPEESAEGRGRLDDGEPAIQRLQNGLPPLGKPVTPEILRANDDERAELYPTFLARAREDWQNGRIREARLLLELQRPPRLESRDVRGFEWYYLQRLYGENRFDFPTGPGALVALTYTPDGTRVLTVSSVAKVKAWDAASGDLIRQWNCGPGAIHAAGFSADCRRLVVASSGNAISVWNVASGTKDLAIQSQPAFNDIGIRPDGRQCAAGGGAQSILLWDLTTGEEVASFGDEGKSVMSVAYSPDGQIVASMSRDGSIRLWRAVEGGEEIRSIRVSDAPGVGPCKVLFSPDGTRLAASCGNVLQVWDTASGESVSNFKGHKQGPIHTFCFSPDGSRVASAATDGIARIWEAASGKELLTLRVGPATLLTFSPDGASFAAHVNIPNQISGRSNSSVAIWETRPPTPEQQDRREARGIVEELFKKTVDRQGVKDFLRKDRWLRDGVREAALAFAEAVELDPQVLNNTSWYIVREPGLSVEEYTGALHQAEEAVRKAPSDGLILNTLGVAQYRMGLYAQSLETLLSSGKLNTIQVAASRMGMTMKPSHRNLRPSLPADVAFLAMSYYRLGRLDEAQQELNWLRSIMEPQVRQMEGRTGDLLNQDLYLESLGFLREAEALIDKVSN